jgi:hypothetical protein
MATKKYLKKVKKVKKGHKKRHAMRGGAPIKISAEKIRAILKNIFDNSIFIGKTITNVVIANAIFEVLGGVVGGEELSQLSSLGINIIATCLQFILTSLRLTASVGSVVGTQFASASIAVGNTLWSAVTSISRICSQNPTITASLATATTSAVVLRGSDIQEIIKQIGHWGFIDYVTIMLFDLLIKSGYFEDERYNQLTLENNEVDEVAEELVHASVNNTPETSPTSSQNEETIDAPIYDPSGREKLQDLLNKMNDEISGLIEKINYDELSTDFSSDALQLTPICHKRKNVEYEDTNTLKASRIDDDDPPPLFYDSSDEEEEKEEEKKQSGGKRTRYRKRKHNKNKTKKIKHAKKHTKKHMKKHTKKH